LLEAAANLKCPLTSNRNGISYTLAKRIANAAGSKLTMDPPLRAGFPSLCLASNHKEALAMMGEALLI